MGYFVYSILFNAILFLLILAILIQFNALCFIFQISFDKMNVEELMQEQWMGSV